MITHRSCAWCHTLNPATATCAASATTKPTSPGWTAAAGSASPTTNGPSTAARTTTTGAAIESFTPCQKESITMTSLMNRRTVLAALLSSPAAFAAGNRAPKPLAPASRPRTPDHSGCPSRDTARACWRSSPTWTKPMPCCPGTSLRSKAKSAAVISARTSAVSSTPCSCSWTPSSAPSSRAGPSVNVGAFTNSTSANASLPWPRLFAPASSRRRR